MGERRQLRTGRARPRGEDADPESSCAVTLRPYPDPSGAASTVSQIVIASQGA
jgi:hypothetical protein